MLFSYGFRLSYLPAFGAIVLMIMLFIPLLLFHIGVPLSRTLEKLWFAVLILFLAVSWLFWSADCFDRTSDGTLTLTLMGAAVLITVATIMFSAVPCWKNGECLTGRWLHPTILMIALQLLFFAILSTAIGFGALKIALGGRKAYFGPVMGLPQWIEYIIPIVPLLIQVLLTLSARKLIARFYDEFSEGSEMGL